MPRQITITKPSSGLRKATFNNPPINLIDPDTIAELRELIAGLESDADGKVVVFRSVDPDFFLAHWDVLADKAKIAAMPLDDDRQIAVVKAMGWFGQTLWRRVDAVWRAAAHYVFGPLNPGGPCRSAHAWHEAPLRHAQR